MIKAAIVAAVASLASAVDVSREGQKFNAVLNIGAPGVSTPAKDFGLDANNEAPKPLLSLTPLGQR